MTNEPIKPTTKTELILQNAAVWIIAGIAMMVISFLIIFIADHADKILLNMMYVGTTIAAVLIMKGFSMVFSGNSSSSKQS